MLDPGAVPYAIDPELALWLGMLPDIALNDTDLNEGRARMRGLQALIPSYVPGQDLDIRDETAGSVAVRVYAPDRHDGPRPALLYMHGGGFVMGDLETADASCREWADKLSIVVVSVDYRLAPEHRYPAPLEDCYTAFTWLADSASTLGVDRARIGVAGDSAGGGMAAGLTLLARDRGGPALCFQFLNVPELDDRLATASMTDYLDTPMWNRPKAIYSWDSYLGPGVRGTAHVPIYAAPARATDLAGLPPAVVTVCQFDPLRDEAINYAQRLMHAGVPTELRHYPGTFHGSIMIPAAAVTKRMQAHTLEDLGRGLHALTVDH